MTTRGAIVRRELRPFRWILALAIVYGVLHAILARVAAHRGILSPDGDVDRGYAVFAVIVLALRIATLVIVPLGVTYKLAMRAYAYWVSRRT